MSENEFEITLYSYSSIIYGIFTLFWVVISVITEWYLLLILSCLCASITLMMVLLSAASAKDNAEVMREAIKKVNN